eukprot:4981509-Pleurochrysis_carterae.AAC.1
MPSSSRRDTLPNVARSSTSRVSLSARETQCWVRSGQMVGPTQGSKSEHNLSFSASMRWS